MKHLRVATCGSTNDEARAAFERGEALPFLLSTSRQIAGRGRHARVWEHHPGNFAGTFVIDAAQALRQTPGAVSLFAGLAVRDALIAHGAPGQDLALKWPNDVLLAERKVAGVLAELVERPGAGAFLVGIGVNLAQPPKEARFPAAAVFGAGEVEAKTFGDTLAQALTAWIDRYRGAGAKAVFDAWRGHAWRLGQPVTINLPEAALAGTFVDIDGAGRLVLRLPSGEKRTISAGDATRP